MLYDLKAPATGLKDSSRQACGTAALKFRIPGVNVFEVAWQGSAASTCMGPSRTSAYGSWAPFI